LYDFADTWKDYMDLRVVLGLAAMAIGRHAEADGAMAASLAVAQTYARRNPVMLARAYRLVASSLRMQGRHDEAANVLRRAGQAIGPLQTLRGGSVAVRDLSTERAALALDRGDAAGALAELSWGEHEDVFQPARIIESPAFVRAAARCQSPMAAEGLRGLDELTSKAVRVQHVHSPQVAYLRALSGLCALRLGNRPRAAELARAARAAFIAQPQVNDYYRRPLVHLERRLGQD
jgi:tetratricopeptide (TPR) repeat protein